MLFREIKDLRVESEQGIKQSAPTKDETLWTERSADSVCSQHFEILCGKKIGEMGF